MSVKLSVWAALIWLLGLTAVGVQALALAGRYFQTWLSGDYIYPQLFAEDVLAGRYPLAGWTLSSAPYLFPDMSLAILLRWLSGPGTILPAYLVVGYLLLTIMLGWAVAATTRAGWVAWWGAALLVNGLLVWQAVADHAHYLWLLGTVGFHGGAVLLGLANFALWVGGEDQPVATAHRWARVGVLALGCLSDTLFFTQAVAPLALALAWRARWNFRDAGLKSYLQALGWAVLAVAVVRIGFRLTGVFHFSKVIRYAPTPDVIARSAADFWRDLASIFLPNNWGVAGYLLGAILLAIVCLIKSCRKGCSEEQCPQLVAGYAGIAFASTILFPLVTGYWRNEHHVRYLLPVFILPLLLLAICGLRQSAVRAFCARFGVGVAVALVSVLLIGWRGAQIQKSSLVWPYRAQEAQLDEYLAAHHLRHGYSDYWQAHQLNTVSKNSLRLFPLRPEGRASFWNNNAFWFYDCTPSSTDLVEPNYNFIITNGLQESALRSRFGEPESVANLAGWTIWLYSSPDGSRRLTDLIGQEVAAFVAGRPGALRVHRGP